MPAYLAPMQINKARKEIHAICPVTSSLILLAFPQSVRVLLKRTTDKLRLLPQVGGQEAVAIRDSGEGSLEGILKGLCRARGGGIGVLNTSKLEETLDGGRG